MRGQFGWPDEATGPWWVRVHVDLSTGIPRCVGLDIRSFTGEPGDVTQPVRPTPAGLREVTTSLLRGVSVPHLLAVAVQNLPKLYEQADAEEPELMERQAVYAQAARRYDLDHFKEVAKTYTDAVIGGHPTRDVAERFGLSRSAAAKHVARCRELGLLGPTRPGMAGGHVNTN